MARFNRIKSLTLPLPTTQQHAADAVCGTAVVDAGTLIRIPYRYRGLTWYRSCILCERYHSLLPILTSQLDRSIILALIKGRPSVRIEYHHTRFLGVFLLLLHGDRDGPAARCTISPGALPSVQLLWLPNNIKVTLSLAPCLLCLEQK